MFTTPFLRSAVALGSQAAKQQAKHVKVSVNTSALSTYATLYAAKVPVFFQWGLFLGTVMGWPLLAEGIVRSIGGVNAVC